MKIDHTVEIETPPESLWTLVTEVEEVKKWVPELVSDEPTEPGPMRVGMKSRMKIREGGSVNEYGSEITRLEPSARLQLRLTGGNLGAGPMDVAYRLTPRGRGCTLDYSVRWEARGLFLRLMSPLLTFVSRRKIVRQLDGLKRLAEASG